MDPVTVITDLLPHSLSVGLLLVFGAASLIVNIVPTPPRPETGARWTAWAGWLAYRACEVAALVGTKAKQRPDTAARLVKAVQDVRVGKASAPELIEVAQDVARALR